MIIITMLWIMGTAGRFWLRHNLFGSNAPVLIAQSHTNALKHYSVKTDGENLRWGKDRFMFLPGMTRSDDDKCIKFDRINKSTGHIDGKPVYLGSVSASVACNPHMSDTIATAVKGGDLIKEFFKDMQESFGDTVRTLHLLNTWNIKDLAEIMNIVIVPQRIKTVYDYGEMKGRNIVKTKETMLFIVIFALLATVLGLAYMISRK